ncbi:F-box domain-containing protein [Mycena kentingensis (nom. inval.)]|nr:F-box domain-containing protein [Mycena kentingensis (nom. inval.)]
MTTDALCPRCRAPSFEPSQILPSAAQNEQLDAVLRSNLDAPSAIHALLPPAMAELARLSEDIPRLRVALAKAVSEQEKMENYVLRLRGACASPIRRLPTEVLLEIMEYLAPILVNGQLLEDDARFYRSEMELLAQRPLIMAARVCSRWRAIVMQNPNLWSTLVIRPELWPAHGYTPYLSVLTKVLARSENHSLTITFRYGDEWSRERRCQAVEREAFRLLLRHAPRWRELNADGINLQRIALPGEIALPQLRHLRLQSWPRHLNFFSQSPHLRSVHILSFIEPIPDLSCAELHTLEYALSLARPWKAQSVLPPLPWGRLGPEATLSLEIGTLDCAALFPEPQGPTISQVGGLTLRLGANDDTGRCLGWIFAFLVLPELRNLTFIKYGGYDRQNRLRWNPGEFAMLAERSGFSKTLTSLTLTGSLEISERDLLAALTILKSLEELRISDPTDQDADLPPRLTDSLLSALNPSDGSPVLVPRLDTLDIITTKSFADSSLLQFLQGRITRLGDVRPGEVFYLEMWCVGAGLDRDSPVWTSMLLLEEQELLEWKLEENTGDVDFCW